MEHSLALALIQIGCQQRVLNQQEIILNTYQTLFLNGFLTCAKLVSVILYEIIDFPIHS